MMHTAASRFPQSHFRRNDGEGIVVCKNFKHASSLPRRDRAGLMLSVSLSFAAGEGDGGRSANAFQYLVAALVGAPAAAAFRPRVPRFR
jgi:hypothetical protein